MSPFQSSGSIMLFFSRLFRALLVLCAVLLPRGPPLSIWARPFFVRSVDFCTPFTPFIPFACTPLVVIGAVGGRGFDQAPLRVEPAQSPELT